MNLKIVEDSRGNPNALTATARKDAKRNFWQCKRLEWRARIDYTLSVAPLNTYCSQALKRAEISFLGEDEGYAARIPGFRGLIATGPQGKKRGPSWRRRWSIGLTSPSNAGWGCRHYGHPSTHWLPGV